MTTTKTKETKSEETETHGKERGTQDRKCLVDHVELTCEAVLGSGSLTIGRLDALASGEVITLDSSPADLVDIRVNGKVIARGEIITVDDRFAIRLTEIG